MTKLDDDEWDFYPCRIDEHEAAILLNLRHDRHPPPTAATTLYRVRIPMREPDDHGMGTPAEVAAMNELEASVIEQVERGGGLWYVARIRTRADWELVFYGAPEHPAALQSIRDVFVDRRTYLDARADPAWGYYREFLLPDDERRRWMQNRRLTDLLAESGDRESALTPRRVDHWAHFGAADARDQFVRAALASGFELQRAAEVAGKRLPFGAQVHREDAVDLEHIHDVVMQLVAIAAGLGGEYEGWDT